MIIFTHICSGHLGGALRGGLQLEHAVRTRQPPLRHGHAALRGVRPRAGGVSHRVHG